MGRSNGKLIPFLRDNLIMNRFMNLKYEDSEIFYIELPRYDKDKIGQFEIILKAWYEINGKLHKYTNYSNAKSVLQAALKKSIYLVSLPSIGKRLRFRFATADEIKENQQLLKEKAKGDQRPDSPSDPPSVSSSGYHSGSEESEVESMQISEMQNNNFLNEILLNPEKYIGGCSNLDDLFSDVNLANADEDLLLQNIQPDDVTLKPPDELEQLLNSVTELKTTPVGVPGSVKKYWLCTQKVKFHSTLQLICESRIIENGNSDIKEGSVVIPNGVFEPGISYDLKKSLELDEMYLFFSPNSA